MGLLNNLLNKKEKDPVKKTSVKKTGSVRAAKASTATAEKTKHDHTHTEKESKKEVKAVSNVKLAKNSTAYKILVKPLVTEKSAVQESKGKYSFVVSRLANKTEVKTAIVQIYGVKPLKVNIVNVDGRQVRSGRSLGRRSDYKKAVVTLPSGSTIDIHAGV